MDKYRDLLTPSENLPLVRNLDLAKLEAHIDSSRAELKSLLENARKLRYFLINILPLQSLTPEQLDSAYHVVTKAILVSLLQLIQVPVHGRNAKELVGNITATGENLEVASMYGWDAIELGDEIKKFFVEIENVYQTLKLVQPEKQQQVLDALVSGNAIHLGFLSKGIISSFAMLNRRLVDLVDEGEISEDEAVQILNENISILAVKRISNQDIPLDNPGMPDPPDTKYEVYMAPYVVEFLHERINANQPIVFMYDELVSTGRTFLAVIQYLIDIFGPEVVKLVSFNTSTLDVDYVPVEQRRDLRGQGNNVVGKVVNELEYEHVWRVMTPDGSFIAFNLVLGPRS